MTSAIPTPEFITDSHLTTCHGFFTRRGGVSTGPYASLNASLSGGDDVARVMQNRALIAGSLAAAPDRLVGVRQVHGTTVVTVTTPWPAGQGPDADALVTATPGIALGVITADCAPVLLWDAAAGVAGAAHAGWRGAAAGVLEQTLAAMRALGANPAAIVAVVGPCLGPDSYEVGPDLRDAVCAAGFGTDGDGAAGPAIEHVFRPGRPPDRFWFDLPAYCLLRLNAAGVARASSLDVDTFTEAGRFFSHRRRVLGDGGPIGHQLSVIMI